MGIGIAAGADHVMHRAPEGIEPVPVERIVGDRRHRAQVRQAGPHPVAGRQMRAVQGARLAGKEPLAQVVGGKQVQVPHLRPLDADDPEEPPRRDLETARPARRHQHLRLQAPPLPRGAIRGQVGARQALDRIADHRGHGLSGGGIGGLGVVWMIGFHAADLPEPTPPASADFFEEIGPEPSKAPRPALPFLSQAIPRLTPPRRRPAGHATPEIRRDTAVQPPAAVARQRRVAPGDPEIDEDRNTQKQEKQRHGRITPPGPPSAS